MNPTNDDDHGAGSTVVVKEQEQATPHFATAAEIEQGRLAEVAHLKRFATLRAHLALAGFALVAADDGEGGRMFMVTRWNLARSLPSLDAVATFADQVGVRHG